MTPVPEVLLRDYTQDQGQFLCEAALHGGYFVRRQYSAFVARKPGGCAERFIQKALVNGHVTAFPSLDRTLIYHVGAKALYRLLGQPDNRNRRLHQPATVRQKLMAFDFVIAHRQHRFLATEQEKLAFFADQGVARELLPNRRYMAHDRGSFTTRYFVDKNPIYISPSSVVHFGFVDAGEYSSFETHLEQYAALFTKLSCFELIYITTEVQAGEGAELRFKRFVAGLSARTALPRELLNYFEARADFDEKHFERFDQKRLDALRAAQKKLSTADTEELYRVWRKSNATAAGTSVAAGFSTFVVPDTYRSFGTRLEIGKGMKADFPKLGHSPAQNPPSAMPVHG